MSVIVRAETADGTVGWGETYGIVAPLAVLAILRDVMIPIVEGRDPRDARAIYDELYDLMRVRGASGGYYGDALAAHRHRAMGSRGQGGRRSNSRK